MMGVLGSDGSLQDTTEKTTHTLQNNILYSQLGVAYQYDVRVGAVMAHFRIVKTRSLFMI